VTHGLLWHPHQETQVVQEVLEGILAFVGFFGGTGFELRASHFTFAGQELFSLQPLHCPFFLMGFSK
jgi:hypothetical protein